MLKKSLVLGAAAAAMSVAIATASFANEAEIKAKAESYTKSEIAKWVADADVVAALNAANAANAGYDQGKIDELDKQWRAEVGAAARPLIDQIMGSAASVKAKGWCSGAGGVVTEIILMDNKGLNVGICDATSDYWQGDEAKYKNTFTKGAGTVFVDDVEQDASTQKFQVQTSMTVVDPASGQPIGVVTVGLDAEGLMMQ
ncbi:hypothetical protein [Dongia deserti]|uniref:hypothetical protein n=1 Tax=Dongia deserti TaxID=2268030 RepID=UPI000E657446|nr:hypothetical protein [Dongia deserti]